MIDSKFFYLLIYNILVFYSLATDPAKEGHQQQQTAAQPFVSQKHQRQSIRPFIPPIQQHSPPLGTGYFTPRHDLLSSSTSGNENNNNDAILDHKLDSMSFGTVPRHYLKNAKDCNVNLPAAAGTSYKSQNDESNKGNEILSLTVANALVDQLRNGPEGHKQLKALEQTFGCSIHFPKKRSGAAARMETEIIEISSAKAQHVHDCRVEIQHQLVQARRLAKPSHFVSVPIVDTRLRDQYSALVKQIWADENLESDCKNEAIFMSPAKLHLTLGVLKLFTQEELETAKQFLDQLFENDERIRQLLAAGPIRVHFPALDYFGETTAEKAIVLFASVQSERMQALANAIDDALTEAGLTERRQKLDVVLHMTMLNTKYLWKKQGRRIFVNGNPLLERYGQLSFDPVDVEEVHLCEMSGGSNDNNWNGGGYKSVHTVHFGAGTEEDKDDKH